MVVLYMHECFDGTNFLCWQALSTTQTSSQRRPSTSKGSKMAISAGRPHCHQQTSAFSSRREESSPSTLPQQVLPFQGRCYPHSSSLMVQVEGSLKKYCRGIASEPRADCCGSCMWACSQHQEGRSRNQEKLGM